MTKYIFLLFFSTTVSTFSFSQKNNTYFNHKNLFEVNYSVHYPLLYGLLTEGSNKTEYVNKDGVMVESKRKSIQSGLQVSYMRTLAKRFAFGVEFNYGTATYAPVGLDVSYVNSQGYQENLYFYAERMKARQTSIIGKVEFGRKQGIFPIGVTHQVGVGYSMYSLKEPEGEVIYRKSEYSYSVDDFEIPFSYKTTWKNVGGITAFYNLNFRVPLSKNILLNFGFRYNANIVFKDESYIYPSQNELIPRYDFASQLRGRMGSQLIKFYTGVAFSF